MFSPRFGLSGGFSGRTQRPSHPLHSFHTYLFDIGAVFRPLPQARIAPEFLIGGGGEILSSSGGPVGCPAFVAGCFQPRTGVFGGFHYGVGVKSYFASHWFWRFGFDSYVMRQQGAPVLLLATVGYTFGKP